MPRKTFVSGDVLTAADMNLLAQDGEILNSSLNNAAGQLGGAWATQAVTLANITLGGATSVARSLIVGKTMFFTWYLTGGSPTATANVATTITITGITSAAQVQSFVYLGPLGAPCNGRLAGSSNVITIFAGMNQTNFAAGASITGIALHGMFELA